MEFRSSQSVCHQFIAAFFFSLSPLPIFYLSRNLQKMIVTKVLITGKLDILTKATLPVKTRRVGIPKGKTLPNSKRKDERTARNEESTTTRQQKAYKSCRRHHAVSPDQAT
jgi:hypothetical protein